MDKLCDKAEGARLLETMRRICDKTGCEEVEYATLAYEEALQKVMIEEGSSLPRLSNAGDGYIVEERKG